MRAMIWTKYGPADVLQLQEVEKPLPKDHEVLIKVNAATVTAGDCEMRSLKMPAWLKLPMRLYVGFRKPQRITILGQELAGEVEAVGAAVTQFAPGDAVFASCGFGMGAYAEYKCLPEDGVMARKPANMSYEEAATVPTGGLEALHFLRKANIQRGQTLLINGAGGSIGTYGVQLAKHFGAQVIAVDSGEKLEMLHSLGADQVIDYTQENFWENGQTYNVIFDVVGKSPFSASIRSLSENGVFLIGNPRISDMLRGRLASSSSRKKVITETSSPTRADLHFLRNLIEAGKMKSVIDRRYPLERTAEAHQYVETGRKQGNVVITVSSLERSSQTV